jgi:hypothetical protein
MIKLFLVLQVQILCYEISAQKKFPIIRYTEFEYKKFNKKTVDSVMSFRILLGCLHRGNVLDGIKLLIDAQNSRLNIKGKVPNKYISFIVSSFRKSRELEKLLLEEINKDYNFKVSEIMDTCEVWNMVVEDSSKLDIFSIEKEGYNGYPSVGCAKQLPGKIFDKYEWAFEGVTMTHIAGYFEQATGKPILTNSKDDTLNPSRYKFYFNTRICNDINLINSVFREKYGIYLKKEIGIVKKHQIEFFDAKE